MKSRATTSVLLLLHLTARLDQSAAAAEYKPAVCAAARPYEGRPIHRGPVTLPSESSNLGPETGFDAATLSRLEDAMRTSRAQGTAQLITAAVADERGFWSTTVNGAGEPRTNRFYWASVGKAFTAVVILQLVEEGKLRLDDQISRWDPTVPNARAITIDHLLQHRSGLFSYNEDLVQHKKPRYLTPDEAIALSAKHGAMFCPGQNWRYSNTGYVLLGRVIEKVDGRPYHEAVNERIIKRLGVRGLRALRPHEVPADIAPFEPTGDDKKEGLMVANWGFAAGSVVGSAADMVPFWQAVLTGRLLSARSTAVMFEDLYPMFDSGTFYGRGAMLFEVPGAGEPRVWLGHGGGASGMQAIVAYSRNEKAFVAVSVTGTTSASAVANLLLKQLDPVDARTGRSF